MIVIGTPGQTDHFSVMTVKLVLNLRTQSTLMAVIILLAFNDDIHLDGGSIPNYSKGFFIPDSFGVFDCGFVHWFGTR